MKRKLLFSFALLGLFFMACESDSLETPQNETQNLQTTVTRTDADDTILFERRMQWFGWLLAESLTFEPSIRTQINNHLTRDNTLNVGELFTDPDFDDFEDGFRAELATIIRNNGAHNDPDHDPDDPTLPFVPSPNGINSAPLLAAMSEDPITAQVNQQVQAYINFMTQDNCIELFFPNGSLVSRANEGKYTSTAHPLTNNTYNYGFQRFYQDGFGCGFPIPCTVEITVDPRYVQDNHNIIVVRPVRSVIASCSYTEYDDIDFTDFLD